MAKKTIKDAEEMKNIPFNVFGNLHDYAVELLFDWAYAKTDGERRIREWLEDWDEESSVYWISQVKAKAEKAEREAEDGWM